MSEVAREKEMREVGAEKEKRGSTTGMRSLFAREGEDCCYKLLGDFDLGLAERGE